MPGKDEEVLMLMLMLKVSRQISRALAFAVLALAAVGCMGDDREDASIKLDAISSETVVLGQTLEFYGYGFLRETEGRTRLLLEGTFTDAFGQEQPSRLVVSPVFGGSEEGEDGRQILTWPRVGPFMNPFTNDNRHGRFEGRLWIENEYSDGAIVTSESQRFALAVGPSVTIERFEPVEADC
ncbi:MAG: hypothetical protein VYD19_10370, partial [Myxococcota bacterium]|nr:hypothetical protein [Myxococcota bacterium]